jgi:hypothetical protein
MFSEKYRSETKCLNRIRNVVESKLSEMDVHWETGVESGEERAYLTWKRWRIRKE